MATMKPYFSDPASVVAAFIHQMHCWEALAGSLQASAQARHRPDESAFLHPEEVRVSDLIHQIPPLIVALYLTERKRAYVPSGSYSTPPEYDPATETVTRVVPKTSSTVIVETDRTSIYMGDVREYVLKKKGGIWLIDSVSAMLGAKKTKLTLV